MSLSSPDAPDYKGAAEQQGQASRENLTQQTWANRPSLQTPWGSMSWQSGTAIDPATGQPVTTWSGNLDLSPQQQASLDSQMAMQLDRSQMGQDLLGQTRSQLMTPLDATSAADARQRAEDAIYGRLSSRLDPQWYQRGNALEAKLLSQGLDPTSEAYRSSMADFGRDRNDAYADAMYRAIEGGGTEAQRQQGLDIGGRTASLNLMNAALNGQQVGMPQMPGFSMAGAAQAPNYLQAAVMQGQQDLANWNAQNGLWSDMIQGGVGAGSSLAFLRSDERLKTDIRRLPVEVLPGVPLASWRWKAGGRGFGVIAQDVERVAPELVMRGADGFLRVNYSALGI